MSVIVLLRGSEVTFDVTLSTKLLNQGGLDVQLNKLVLITRYWYTVYV
jgi:hypothetical protein